MGNNRLSKFLARHRAALEGVDLNALKADNHQKARVVKTKVQQQLAAAQAASDEPRADALRKLIRELELAFDV